MGGIDVQRMGFRSGMIVACWIGAHVALAQPPTIFQTLDPVRPDETLLLFGADVSAKATAEGFRLEDAAVEQPTGQVVRVAVGRPGAMDLLQASDLSAKVLIPKAWAPGVFAVRVRNADGFSAWQFANRPAIWWQMSGVGGKLNPGGALRVFGKNFGVHSRLWLERASGAFRELKVGVAAENEVASAVPDDLAPGHYQLWLHNGHGGAAGFGEPLQVEISAAEKWPDTRFDVRDFGAKGDNRHDDTSAIRRALAWAGQKGGAVVYLPRGTYIVTGKLGMPRRTVLRGEDRDLVTIKVPKFWPAAPTLLPEFDGLFTGDGEFAVENLFVAAQPVRRIVAAPDVPAIYGKGMARMPASTPSAPGVRLKNLRIWHLYFANRIADIDPSKRTSEGPSTIVVKGADFSLEDSEVISAGMPIQLVGATRARVSGNVLRTGKGWYGFWDFRTGIFERNDISAGDLDGSFGGVEGVANDVMFSQNHWHHAFGGEREALTFDAPYSAVWMGRVTASGTALRLGAKEGGAGDLASTSPDDLLAIVAGGKGVGQAVGVVKVSAEIVELAQPFAVPVDVKSTVVLGTKKSRVLVVDNVIEDASVAVQLYAQTHEFLVARNRCLRTGGSYSHSYDVWEGGKNRRYSYSLFNQWLDNVFEEGFVFDQGSWPDAYVGVTGQRSPGLTETVPGIGNRLVGNRLTAGTEMGATNVPPIESETLLPGNVPLARDSIMERNVIAATRVGLRVDVGHWFTLLRGNKTERVTLPIDNHGRHTEVVK